VILKGLDPKTNWLAVHRQYFDFEFDFEIKPE
jgi:hypothetical protein